MCAAVVGGDSLDVCKSERLEMSLRATLLALVIGAIACTASGQNPGGCLRQPAVATLDPPTGTTGRVLSSSTYTLTGQFLANTSITVHTDNGQLQVFDRTGNDTSVSFHIGSSPVPMVVNGVLIVQSLDDNCSTINISIQLFPQGINYFLQVEKLNCLKL